MTVFKFEDWIDSGCCWACGSDSVAVQL